MIWWNLAFIVGLNFTHLDNGPLKHLTLDPADIADWGKGMWMLALSLLLLIAAILFVICSSYIRLGIFEYYILYAVFLFSVMVWNTQRNAKKGRYVHIHHYTLGLILMSFISIQSPFASVVHAFLHGMFIEGGCRWGFDPIWEIPDDYSETPSGQSKRALRLSIKQSEARK